MSGAFVFCLMCRWLVIRCLPNKSHSESFVAAYDCRLAHPTTCHTPSGTTLHFAGCGFLWSAVAVPKEVEFKARLGAVFCLVLYSPRFLLIFDCCRCSKSGRSLMRRLSQAIVMEQPPALSWSRTDQTNVAKHGVSYSGGYLFSY